MAEHPVWNRIIGGENMSTIIRELLGDGETIVYLVLNDYRDKGHITSYVEMLGKKDIVVSEIFAENVYEPHYYTDTRSLVLYTIFNGSRETQETLTRIFEQLAHEEPETFVMARYKAYDYFGKKYKDVEYRFYAKEREKWEHLLYEVNPYA